MKEAREEIFPLVDAEGNVTGREKRSNCHNGSMLLHPVVHLHVFNNEGELYLQKRADSKEIFPGLWDSSVGGHIAYGESPAEAVVREAYEELGLQEISPVFILKYIIETDVERELTYCYYIKTDKQPIPNTDELADGRFWKMEEIRRCTGKGMFTPNFEKDFHTFLVNKNFRSTL